MNRRQFIGLAGAIGGVALAGCTSQPSDDSPAGNDGTEDDGATHTDTPTDDETDGSGGNDGSTESDGGGANPALEDATFEVVEQTSAAQEPGADVEFDAGAGQVLVRGTIQGSDGCKTADLQAVDYHAAADEVTVSVVTKNRPGTGDQACTQQLVYISYEATVTFSGGIPSAASVVHDGEGVTSGAHASATAGDGTTDATTTNEKLAEGEERACTPGLVGDGSGCLDDDQVFPDENATD